jgi:hypothetical protein
VGTNAWAVKGRWTGAHICGAGGGSDGGGAGCRVGAGAHVEAVAAAAAAGSEGACEGCDCGGSATTSEAAEAAGAVTRGASSGVATGAMACRGSGGGRAAPEWPAMARRAMRLRMESESSSVAEGDNGGASCGARMVGLVRPLGSNLRT